MLYLLDAFRSDYISYQDTPFLYKCSKQGRYIKKIRPSAGFCERTEIFTGLKPKESGFFTAIGFDPENSPYKDHQFLKILGRAEVVLSNWIEAIFPNRSQLYMRIVRRLFIKTYKLAGGRINKLKFYSIPLSFLNLFSLTEDKKELNEQTFDNAQTIFKWLDRRGEDYFLGSFTSLGKPSNGTDADRLKKAIEAYKTDNFKFIPIYISMADSTGHKYGPNSSKMKQTCKELDKMLKINVDEFLKYDEDVVFMFLGDHGMSDVFSLIDIEKKLLSESKAHKLLPGTDYVYFLDSTIFRIWFLTSKAKEVLEPIIKKDEMLLEFGTFITEDISKKYSIPVNDRRYGDLTWWANTGVLIFPDFFHSKKHYKGMHGYKPEDFSTFGTCLLWGSNTEQVEIEEKNLFQVYDEIKNIIKN